MLASMKLHIKMCMNSYVHFSRKEVRSFHQIIKGGPKAAAEPLS